MGISKNKGGRPKSRLKSLAADQEAILRELQRLNGVLEALSNRMCVLMEWVWERQSLEETPEQQNAMPWQQVCSPHPPGTARGEPLLFSHGA